VELMSAVVHRTRTRSPAVRRAIGRLLLPAWFDAPFSRHYGKEHGSAIDRHYIEQFLALHRADVHGEVLELKDDLYTRRFGHAISRSAVLDVDPHNPRADIVADLAEADAISDSCFDCFILTQTLQYIPDPQRALAHARRILRPGGVLLATLPALSQPAPPEVDYWRFLPHGAKLLFSEVFRGELVEISCYGNLSAVVGGLAGISQEQVQPARLEPQDDQFPLVVAVRAVRGTEPRP
jgi:SAM-dependent methyltransferase